MQGDKSDGFGEAPIPIRLLEGSTQCFVCGSENPRGLHCRFWATSEGVFTEWKPEPWVVGYEGRVHGGILASLLDEAMIWAVYARTGHLGVTAELILRFRRPVSSEGAYQVEGRLLRGGRIHEAEAWISDAGGNRYVTAFAKILIPKERLEARGMA